MAGGWKRAFCLSLLISTSVWLALAAVIGIWFAACTALLMLGGSAIPAVMAARTGVRPAAAVWGGVSLGQLAAGVLTAVLLFGAYFGAVGYTSSFCERVDRLPTVAERLERLDEMDDMAWLKALFERLTNKGEFVFDCSGRRHALEAMLRDGTCPTYPPAAAKCRCGPDQHPAATPCTAPKRPMCIYQGTTRKLVCR